MSAWPRPRRNATLMIPLARGIREPGQMVTLSTDQALDSILAL